MKLQTKITVEEVSKAIGEFLTNVTERIVPVGKLIAQLVDESGYDVYAKLQADHPRLSLNTIAIIERVGRGHLLAELAFDGSPGARRLAACPEEVQRKMYHEPVKLLRSANGKTEVYEKPLNQLDQQEVRQVFADDNRPRTLEEKKQFVSKANEPSVKRLQPLSRFTIRDDGSVVIMAETELSLVALEAVYNAAKAKAMNQLATKKK